MNLLLEPLNALLDEQAQVEKAEQLLSRLQCLDLDAYQTEYLDAWQRFYIAYPHYLFPNDRGNSECEPTRLEDVSTLSYERTAEAVKRERQSVLQSNKNRLANALSIATSSTTRRHKLAHECHNTVERLEQYEADVFADLTAAIYNPCLPPIYSSWPERRVDEPATVGAALGLLDFLAYVYAEYKTSQLPTTAPPAATPNKLEQLSAATHPWAEIETLAEKIGLRRRGSFTMSDKWVSQAVAGFIDALREAGWVTATNLPALYADFSCHYGRKITADRITNTRTTWQTNARQALGLD